MYPGGLKRAHWGPNLARCICRRPLGRFLGFSSHTKGLGSCMLAFHFLLCVPGVLKRAHVAQILSGIHLGNCWVILLGSPLALDIDIYVGIFFLGGQNPVWNLILYLIRLIFTQSCTFNITKSATLVSFCASALKFTWCLLFKVAHT